MVAFGDEAIVDSDFMSYLHYGVRVADNICAAERVILTENGFQ